ncbi:MAG: hypothetical protein CL431_03220 [Acidimicrobiaceae bacterium]|jgi:DNA replication and repair protein RecF|nr:hypothetical protein [Acidimicrobiaceae bacterium]|tara:strand:- start:18842 stop:19918 length:1077 start_codon:yes stop_codon:yes gene_type:complete
MVHLRQLWLQNFRNYSSEEIIFSKGTNVLFGQNGQGKTNLLEAIYYLGSATSFRGAPVDALIKKDFDTAVIRAEIEHEERDLLVEAEISALRQNTIAINKQKIRPIRNLVGLIPMTIFGPDDLTLVKEGPSNRRTYIDELLIRTHPKYLKKRTDLEAVLKQRNAFLKQTKGYLSREGRETLSVWSEQFATLSHEWGELRKKTLITIQELAQTAYTSLAGTKEVLELTYTPSWLERGLLSLLNESENDELRRSTTLIGPHRDDIEICFDGMPARTHSSQGEQRTIALSLRVAGHHLLHEIHKTKPVLLLDDVFSELDAKRTERLLHLLVADQTFITTATEPQIIEENAYREIKNGKILN